MKNFQQNKIAMKIALSFMLGSALFLNACSDSTNYSAKDMKDTEKKGREYYDKNLEEAFEKIKWCAFEIIEKKDMDDTNRSNCEEANKALSWSDGKTRERYKKFRDEIFVKYGQNNLNLIDIFSK